MEMVSGEIGCPTITNIILFQTNEYYHYRCSYIETNRFQLQFVGMQQTPIKFLKVIFSKQ